MLVNQKNFGQHQNWPKLKEEFWPTSRLAKIKRILANIKIGQNKKKNFGQHQDWPKPKEEFFIDPCQLIENSNNNEN